MPRGRACFETGLRQVWRKLQCGATITGLGRRWTIDRSSASSGWCGVESSRISRSSKDTEASAVTEDIDLSTTLRGESGSRRGVGIRSKRHRAGVRAQRREIDFQRVHDLPDARIIAIHEQGLDSGSVAGQAVLALLPVPRHTAVFNAQGGMQKNPYPGEEFDLGLTFGPACFPAHAFTGDRAFFTTVEYRWVASAGSIQVAGVGLAGFADYGGAWYSGSDVRTGADAGVGCVSARLGRPPERVRRASTSCAGLRTKC